MVLLNCSWCGKVDELICGVKVDATKPVEFNDALASPNWGWELDAGDGCHDSFDCFFFLFEVC